MQTKKYLLMNKNVEVLTFNFDNELGAVTEINEIKNLNYAPYSFKNYKDNIRKALDDWLASRYGYNSKTNVNLTSPDELNLKQNIVKSYGLSLSDQYWFHDASKNVKWEDINFFQNDFEYKTFIPLTFSSTHNISSKTDMIYSPNSTTGGQLDKAWIIDSNKQRCLLKSANTMFLTEPINEILAYKTASILDMPTTKYETQVISDLTNPILVSKCATFINPNTELIPASQIVTLSENSTFKETVNKYVDFLIANKVIDATEKIQKQLLLDALLVNTDRHLNNFGVIRDVNTLKIIDVAPNFDCGRILGTTFPYSPDKYNRDKFVIHEFGFNVSLDDVLSLINQNINLTKEQYNELYTLPKFYKRLLGDNISYTSLRNVEEVEHLCNVFKENIDYIEQTLEKNNCFKDVEIDSDIEI